MDHSTNLASAIAHRVARQAIVTQACIVIVAGAGAAWLARGIEPNDLGGWLPAATWIVVLAAGAGLLLAARSSRLLVWERKLAALDAGSNDASNNVTNGEATPLDPLSLAPAPGAAAADRGWNRLVEQGRRWQAFTEVEQALASRLENAGPGQSMQLLEAVASGIAAVDADGKISEANHMLAGICGGDSPKHLIGQPFDRLLQLDEPSRAVVSAAAGGPCAAEWTMAAGENRRRLRGERRPLAGENAGQQAGGNAGQQGGGNAGQQGGGNAGQQTASAGHVWTIRDVTQQRLAEAMREQFLSAATHEFRTPLANIRAYAESLAMSADQSGDQSGESDRDERKRFYNVIQSESQRLAQLVDDLLDISRMQAGALALDRGETDLARLVEEAAAKVRGQLRDKELQFACEFPPKYPKFAADKSKLTAALVNLLGNAAKYTPAGGKVTFRVEVNAQDVQFSIADTGIGISAEELPKIFDRFFRSGDDRVREITGSGLGLALAQEIARLHGGDIFVESVLNKGSTFRMKIPLDSSN